MCFGFLILVHVCSNSNSIRCRLVCCMCVYAFLVPVSIHFVFAFMFHVSFTFITFFAFVLFFLCSQFILWITLQIFRLNDRRCNSCIFFFVYMFVFGCCAIVFCGRLDQCIGCVSVSVSYSYTHGRMCEFVWCAFFLKPIFIGVFAVFVPFIFCSFVNEKKTEPP